MKIENMDFTPIYYRNGRHPAVMSEDEHDFIQALFGESTWTIECKRSQAYIIKLHTYYERFDNQMPIPIRKELLRSIAE